MGIDKISIGTNKAGIEMQLLDMEYNMKKTERKAFLPWPRTQAKLCAQREQISCDVVLRQVNETSKINEFRM